MTVRRDSPAGPTLTHVEVRLIDTQTQSNIFHQDSGDSTPHSPHHLIQVAFFEEAKQKTETFFCGKWRSITESIESLIRYDFVRAKVLGNTASPANHTFSFIHTRTHNSINQMSFHFTFPRSCTQQQGSPSSCSSRSDSPIQHVDMHAADDSSDEEYVPTNHSSSRGPSRVTPLGTRLMWRDASAATLEASQLILNSTQNEHAHQSLHFLVRVLAHLPFHISHLHPIISSVGAVSRCRSATST